MRGGHLLAHLPALLDEVDAPAYLPGLIEAKAEAEHAAATDLDGGAVARDIEELHRVLDEAQERSRLPETVTALEDLHDLVVRARLAP
ncbi:hypothetical protein ACFYRI_12410 [Streptomyces microflavus]|uniref:hypothetical protein n=1 Tax=Streptomyces microflavus TaxID=1919 RepID=UPI003676DDBC